MTLPLSRQRQRQHQCCSSIFCGLGLGFCLFSFHPAAYKTVSSASSLFSTLSLPSPSLSTPAPPSITASLTAVGSARRLASISTLSSLRPASSVSVAPRLALLVRPAPISSSFSTRTSPSTLLSRPRIPAGSTRSIATMSGSVHNLTSQADFQKALGEKGVMVIDCFATWCGPCKMIAPKVAEFAKKYSNARFYKVDVDEVPDVAQELKIRAMPTFKVFKDGQLAADIVGANAPAVEKAIVEALG